MNRFLFIKPKAEADLESAKHWLNDQRDGLGEEFLDAVEVAFGRILATPDMHQIIRADVRRAVIRRFRYLVFYRVKPDRVTVLAVLDGRRDPSTWIERFYDVD